MQDRRDGELSHGAASSLPFLLNAQAEQIGCSVEMLICAGSEIMRSESFHVSMDVIQHQAEIRVPVPI
jgi:hypothetical protein